MSSLGPEKVCEGMDKSNSKNIAKNSIILFVRMVAITLVNLYAVRLVLRGLGDVDYGIYNALAGVVTVLGSLNTVLSLAIQRYYSMALGNNDQREMSEVFSASVNINLWFVGCIILLSETLGLWFVCNHMVWPEERLSAVVGCFHLSLVSFLCTFVQVPFLAAVIAKENMGIFAGVSLVECVIRLLVAACIPVVTMDGLLFYSGGLALTSILIALSYMVVCRFRYKECHYIHVERPHLYKNLLSFSGWTMYGSLSNVGLMQGNTILLNVFFGPLLNTAFAVALQINNAFTALCNTIIVAFRPAMVKSYAKRDFGNVNQLFYAGNKFILYLLTGVAIPLVVEMDTVLHAWLGAVSLDTVLFARFVIVYVVCMAMNNPITALIQAVGKVKAYHIRVDSITLLSLPLTWCLFKCGMPAYSVFFSMIGLCVLAHVERLFCLRKYYEPFSIQTYLKVLILPFVPILLCTVMFTLWLQEWFFDGIYGAILGGFCAFLFCMGLVFLFGVNRQEREAMLTLVNSFIRRS